MSSEQAYDDARHQPMGEIAVGDVMSGFHMDLRGVAGSYGTPGQAEAWLDLLIARRTYVAPVTVQQLGIGAWQLGIDPACDDRADWARVARLVAEWAAIDMDGHGRFAYYQPMPHTYRIPAPWFSAMAQALGVSLFVRHGMLDDAARAAASLLDDQYGLVTRSVHGPILEEYPASPRPHVLNGWIWGLFGLHDLAHAESAPASLRAQAAAEFEAGTRSLAAQLDEYETGSGWSTYDRYPHPIANVASPFYQRLHVEMLRALARISDDRALAEELRITAGRWERALGRPVVRAAAVARKVGFRLVRPRRKAA